MKKQIAALGTVLLFVVAGFAVVAQDDAIDPQVAARLAAKRAAEATADAAPATPADTAAAAPATVAATDTGATNAASTDPDEIRRKAALAAAEKEAMVAAVNLPASQASFKIITDRNIFDPRRAPGSRGGGPPPILTQPTRIEQFFLGGTSLKVGKGGWVAFFDGDGVPSYPPTRSVGDMVNEFKIVEISKDQVKLVNTRLTNSEPVVLEALKGLRRNDNGPWTLAYNTQNYGAQIARQAPDTMAGQPPFSSPVIQQIQFMGDDGSGAYTPYGGNPDDPTGGQARTGRRRGQPGGGGPGGGGGNPGNGRTRGGRGGGGGGFGATDTSGGFGAGGFGGGGGANTQFAPPVTIDPNAPVDPAVLARLAARRAAEQ